MTLTEEQRGTVGFDLEKARAALEEAIDRMSLAVRDEDGDVWEADPEQAEILQAILDRTEIAENHRCLELQYQLDSAESEIERLRAALAESEKVVEHKGKSATHWYDEHLRAQTDLTQSKRVIDQQAARIKELEDALVEELARGDYFDESQECEGYWWDRKNTSDCTQNDYRRNARLKLQAKGKIGPDADAKPRVWQITGDRITAIDQGLRFLEWSNAKNGSVETKKHIATLQTMLEETGDKNGFEGRNKMRIETIR